MRFWSHKPAQPETVEPHLRVEIKNDSFLHVDAGIYYTLNPIVYQGDFATIFPNMPTPPNGFMMKLPEHDGETGIQIVFRNKRQFAKAGKMIGYIYDGHLLEGNAYRSNSEYEFIVKMPQPAWDEPYDY